MLIRHAINVKVSIEDAWDYSAIREADVSVGRVIGAHNIRQMSAAPPALTNLRSPLDDAKVKIRKKRPS